MRPLLDSVTAFNGLGPIDKVRLGRFPAREFASSGGSSSSATSAQQALAQNLAIRQNILANAIPVMQNVRSGSVAYTPGSPTTWTVLASNVGLIRRFWLELTIQVNSGTSGPVLKLTPFGLSNLLSNVQFIDQNNRLRINTTGAHLHLAASQKRRRPFGGAIAGASGAVQNLYGGAIGDLAPPALSGSPTVGVFPEYPSASTDPAFGINYPVQAACNSIASGDAGVFSFIYEIPVVNSNQDLTGAIYANQTTSNNQLQFTLNPNLAVYEADPFNAVFVASGENLSTVTAPVVQWTLYQDFLDQLPVDNTGFAQLPPIDIAYALCYQMINPGAITQGSDNLYALPPFNVYQDLMLFWDNYNGTTAAGYLPGGDINYIKVQIANTYILQQYDPLALAVKTRNLMGTDFPAFVSPGTTYNATGSVFDLDFRHKPLSVNQLSSTNIVFNPSKINSPGSQSLQIGQEYIWYANQAAA